MHLRIRSLATTEMLFGMWIIYMKQNKKNQENTKNSSNIKQMHILEHGAQLA